MVYLETPGQHPTLEPDSKCVPWTFFSQSLFNCFLEENLRVPADDQGS